jgi:hypothetical protein
MVRGMVVVGAMWVDVEFLLLGMGMVLLVLVLVGGREGLRDDERREVGFGGCCYCCCCCWYGV